MTERAVRDDAHTSVASLYEDYVSWAVAGGERPFGKKNWNTRIEALGLATVKKSGMWCKAGMRLRTAQDGDEDPNWTNGQMESDSGKVFDNFSHERVAGKQNHLSICPDPAAEQQPLTNCPTGTEPEGGKVAFAKKD